MLTPLAQKRGFKCFGRLFLLLLFVLTLHELPNGLCAAEGNIERMTIHDHLPSEAGDPLPLSENLTWIACLDNTSVWTYNHENNTLEQRIVSDQYIVDELTNPFIEAEAIPTATGEEHLIKCFDILQNRSRNLLSHVFLGIDDNDNLLYLASFGPEELQISEYIDTAKELYYSEGSIFFRSNLGQCKSWNIKDGVLTNNDHWLLDENDKGDYLTYKLSGVIPWRDGIREIQVIANNGELMNVIPFPRENEYAGKRIWCYWSDDNTLLLITVDHAGYNPCPVYHVYYFDLEKEAMREAVDLYGKPIVVDSGYGIRGDIALSADRHYIAFVRQYGSDDFSSDAELVIQSLVTGVSQTIYVNSYEQGIIEPFSLSWNQ